MDEILDNVYIEVFFDKKSGKIRSISKDVSVSTGDYLDVIDMNRGDSTLVDAITNYVDDITYDDDVYLAVYKTKDYGQEDTTI